MDGDNRAGYLFLKRSLCSVLSNLGEKGKVDVGDRLRVNTAHQIIVMEA